MSKVNLEAHDAVAVLRLKNGVTNAISPELVDDLLATMKQMKIDLSEWYWPVGTNFSVSALICRSCFNWTDRK
jgi:hypothetical protein